MFQRVEGILRNSSSQRDMHFATIVHSLLALRGKDIPLDIELPETAQFSDEVRRQLVEEGYTMFVPLMGQSIQTLRKRGCVIPTRNHDCVNIENLQSRRSEVAFNPNGLFLPDSNNKTLQEQLAMVTELSTELRQRTPGIEVVIGGVADYIELAQFYFKTTGKPLFSDANCNKYRNDHARTITKVGPHVAHIGTLNGNGAIHVADWLPSLKDSGLWIIPLVVPSST